MTNRNRRSIFHHARLPILALALVLTVLVALLALHPRPAGAQAADVWSATLTAHQTAADEFGCLGVGTVAAGSCVNKLSDNDFRVGSTDYTISRIGTVTSGSRAGTLRIDFDTDLSTDAQKLTLWVGSKSFAFANANEKTSTQRHWYGSGLSWSVGDKVSLRLTAPDATLSALSVSPGTLTPDFDSETDAYLAEVGSGVGQVTLEYTASDANATVAVLSAADSALTDADSNAAGFQVDLGAGGTTTVFKVKVTIQGFTKTYTVSVARAIVVPEKEVPYNWPLIPRGLGPGDSFRLLFVTSNGFKADSTDVAHYDFFVQALAFAGHDDVQAHSAHFKALASVGGASPVHARVHTATIFDDSEKGVPIYWLGWRMAARDYQDFYDGIWMVERGTDEFGADLGVAPGAVWTGTSDQGTASADPLGADNPTMGRLNKQWDPSENPLSASSAAKSETHPLYALSGVFTVAEPEPADGNVVAWVEGMQLRTTVSWPASHDPDVTGYQIQRALQYRPDNGKSTFGTGQVVYEVVVADTGPLAADSTSYDIDHQHHRNFWYRVLPIKNGVVQESAATYGRPSTTVVPPEVHMKWNPNMADGDILAPTALRRLVGASTSESHQLGTTDTTFQETEDYLKMPGNAVELEVLVIHTDLTTTEQIGPITVQIPPIVGERHYCVLNNSWTTYTDHPGDENERTNLTSPRVPVDRPKTWFRLDTDAPTPVTSGTGRFSVSVTQASESPLSPDHGCFPVGAVAYDHIPLGAREDEVFQAYDMVRFIGGYVPHRDTLNWVSINREAHDRLGERLPDDATVIGTWTVRAEQDPSSPRPWLSYNGVGVVVYDRVVTGRTIDGDTVRLTQEDIPRQAIDVWRGVLEARDLGSGDRGCSNGTSTARCNNTEHVLYESDSFTYDSTDYSIIRLRLYANGTLQVRFNRALTTKAENLILRVGSRSFPFRSADSKTSNGRQWDDTDLVWDEDADIHMWLMESLLVWTGQLTVKDTTGGDRGCNDGISGAECSDTNVLSPGNQFTHDSESYGIEVIDRASNGWLHLDFSRDLTSATGKLILRIGDRDFSLGSADVQDPDFRIWYNSGLTWNVGDVVNLRLIEPIGGGQGAEGDLPVPRNLAATSQSGRVELTWDPVDGATGYRVLRKGATDSEHLQIAVPTVNSHTDGDVELNRSYSYKVEATDASGSSDASEPVSVTVMPPPPLAPTGLTATASGTSVTVTWQAPDDDSITGYMVLRLARDADPPEDPQLIAQIGPETTEITDTDVEADTAYEYRVVSFNLTALSEPATVDITVPGEAESSPGPLAGFTLVDASDQTVLATLTDGAAVALSDPPGGSYALRADIAEGETVGSVKMELSGAKTVTRTENIAPYSLYGDSNEGGDSNLTGQALPAGSYTITATAYSERRRGGDQLGTLEVSFTVTQANRAPEFASATYSFSIAEDAATGAAVGSVSATDADSDTLSYTITAGNADGRFAIDGSTGAVTTAAALDYENTSSYALAVQADDGNGGTATATVNVSVTDVDENSAPEFGSDSYNFSVAEDAATGSAVGSVSATDADSDTLSYTITAGNADGRFAIDGSTGAVTTAAALDYENTSSYALAVQADDGNGGTATATVNVSVTDVDENSAPEFGSDSYNFSVAEDAATGSAVGSVSATDADSDTLSYTITAGNADGRFAIDGSTGAVTTAAALDYENTSSYALAVQADDGNGGTATATVNVSVTEVDENTRQACPPEGVDLADFDNADRVVVRLAWLVDNEAAVTSGDPVVIPSEAILAFYKSGREEIPLTSFDSITLSPTPIGSHDDVDGVEGFSYERSLITHVTFSEGCVHKLPVDD